MGRSSSASRPLRHRAAGSRRGVPSAVAAHPRPGRLRQPDGRDAADARDTLAAVLAAMTGDAAHGPVEAMPGLRPIVTEHERWGEWTRNIFLVVFLIELIAIALRKSTMVRYALIASAAVGVVGLFALYEAGEHGGEIVYGYAGGVGTRSGNPEDVSHLFLAGLYQQALADRQGRPPAGSQPAAGPGGGALSGRCRGQARAGRVDPARSQGSGRRHQRLAVDPAARRQPAAARPPRHADRGRPGRHRVSAMAPSRSCNRSSPKHRTHASSRSSTRSSRSASIATVTSAD